MREGWSEVRLIEVTSKIGSGVTPRGGSSVYVEKGIPIFRSQNIYNGEFSTSGLAYINDTIASKMKNVEVVEDDVLLNITGDSVARCCIPPREFIPGRVNQHVSIIRPRKEKLNPRYLMYSLISPRMQATLLAFASGAGATRNALTKSVLENTKINLPPLKTQRKIASILSAYDDLIENNLKRIELYCELAETNFLALFANNKDWNKIGLNDVSKYFGRGVTPIYEEGTGFYGINQKANNGLTLNTKVFKEYKRGDWIPKEKYATKGDLLINSLGEGTIGRVHYYMGENDKHPIDQHISIFRAKDKAVGLFVFQFFNSEYGQGHLHTLKKGGTNMTMLNIGDLRKIEIYIPTEEVLEDHYKSVINLFKSKAILENQNQHLKEARDILLPRLMSGMIDPSTSSGQVVEKLEVGSLK